MKTYLKINRIDFSLSLAFIIINFIFLQIIWKPELEYRSQVIPYLVVIIIFGIASFQLFSYNRKVKSTDRDYPVNNFLIYLNLCCYLSLLMYFSFEFGTEIAELNMQIGIRVKQ